MIVGLHAVGVSRLAELVYEFQGMLLHAFRHRHAARLPNWMPDSCCDPKSVREYGHSAASSCWQRSRRSGGHSAAHRTSFQAGRLTGATRVSTCVLHGCTNAFTHVAAIIASGKATGIDAALERSVDNHEAATAVLESGQAIDDRLVLDGALE